jgi:hypothetical protein
VGDVSTRAGIAGHYELVRQRATLPSTFPHAQSQGSDITTVAVAVTTVTTITVIAVATLFACVLYPVPATGCCIFS